MAGIENKSARQIDLRGRGPRGVVTVTLNPGFNVVDDEKAALVMKNPLCKQLEEHGVIATNIKQTEEDRLMKEKVRLETEREAHELDKPERSASLVDGDAAGAVGKATAVGAGPNGVDVDEDELGL